MAEPTPDTTRPTILGYIRTHWAMTDAEVQLKPSSMTARGFGEELRRRRTSAGLTLRSLAQRVAFDYSYLAQVERGDRAGSARLAHRCDQALDAHGQLVRLFADQKVRQLMHQVRGDA